jgi:tRNA-(ms[2]io[6]A)-hydroxylase
MAVELVNFSTNDLPLGKHTPEEWADRVLEDPLALLNDHAHLEKKAATNALDLLNRWPEPNPPENWVRAMTAIARDEVEHLATVTRLLARRGGRLTRTHRNPYAKALRNLVRWGNGLAELTDRLMVSALIEARSCERFALLANACADREMQRLYARLFASEAGHYRVFIDLARALPDAADIEPRWEAMLADEARIITEQAPGPGMHSGFAE